MLLLSCNVETNPCPLVEQKWVASTELYNFNDLGITSAEISHAFGFGFGVVLLGFLLGYVLGLALGLIKKV